MNRKITGFVAALLLAVGASGQEKWSLRQCVDYAVEHNIAVRQQGLQVEGAEIELNTARNGQLPGVSASVGQNFNFGRSQNPGTGIYEANQSASTSVGLSASANLFSGGRTRNQIRGGEFDLLAATAGLARAREDIELTVTSYYLTALLRKELLGKAGEQVGLTEKLLARTDKLIEAERVPGSRRLDVLAQLAQSQLAVTEARNALDAALLDLVQAMNLSGAQGFDILEPGAEGSVGQNGSPGLSAEAIYEEAVGIRPGVRQAEYALESGRSAVGAARAARYPNLSLGASYNSGYSHVFGEGAIEPFFDQIRNNQRQSVGLSLGIPIFNRLQTRNAIRSAELRTRGLELELDGVKQALYKEIQQAHRAAVAAESRYRSSEQVLTAARAAWEATELRYEAGRSTAYELSEAQTLLFSGEADLLQAKYESLFQTKILDFYRGVPIEIR